MQPYATIDFHRDGTLFHLRACERETIRHLLGQIAPALDPTEGERFVDGGIVPLL